MLKYTLVVFFCFVLLLLQNCNLKNIVKNFVMNTRQERNPNSPLQDTLKAIFMSAQMWSFMKLGV